MPAPITSFNLSKNSKVSTAFNPAWELNGVASSFLWKCKPQWLSSLCSQSHTQLQDNSSWTLFWLQRRKACSLPREAFGTRSTHRSERRSCSFPRRVFQAEARELGKLQDVAGLACTHLFWKQRLRAVCTMGWHLTVESTNTLQKNTVLWAVEISRRPICWHH